MEGPKNHRQLVDPACATLLQHIKCSGLESVQHFSVHPLSLSIALGMSNRSEGDLASKVLDVLHEGMARELGATVSDYPGGHSKSAHQSFHELDR